jgi:subtilase family serine protease
VRLVVDDEATEKSVASLDAGKETTVRFDDLRLTKGEHRLAARVDATKAISEANEGNNELKVAVTCNEEG